MAISAHAIAGGALATVGVILATPATAAPPTVAGGGVTLHSVSVELPDSDRTFPGGAAADAINNNCLACHSAGMVLTQPRLSRATWQAEVDKMRDIYKAPVAAEDVLAIVDYLANLRDQ
jgi:hypothetical protein